MTYREPDLGTREAEFRQTKLSSASYVIAVICILTGSSCAPLGMQGEGQNLVPSIVMGALWILGGALLARGAYKRGSKKTLVEIFPQHVRKTESGVSRVWAFSDVVRFEQRIRIHTRTNSRFYNARLQFRDGSSLELLEHDLEGMNEAYAPTLAKHIPVEATPWAGP